MQAKQVSETYQTPLVVLVDTLLKVLLRSQQQALCGFTTESGLAQALVGL